MSERPKNNPPWEQDAVYTTIVGGRPPGCGTAIGAIPRGLEVLVKKASVDDEFKELLLERRADAAREIGLELDPAEAAMLGVIPRAQLEATIARTRVAPENRRAFMGQAAALMLAALGGSLLSGCKSETPTDTATPKLTPTNTPPPLQTPTAAKVAGVRAEQPVDSVGLTIERPERLEQSIGERPARMEEIDGIRPDRPGEESPELRSMRGLRPVRPEQPGIAGQRIEQPPTVWGIQPQRPNMEEAPKIELVIGGRIKRPEEPPMIESAGVRVERPAARISRGQSIERPPKAPAEEPATEPEPDKKKNEKE